MLKKGYFLLFMFFALASYGQKDSVRPVINQLDFKMDTLNVKTVASSPAKVWYESAALISAATLIIALMTIGVNVYISRHARKTTLQAVENQMKSSTEIATFQFKATLNSKNRQDWINDVRNCLSEFMTQAKLLNIALQATIPNLTRQDVIHEKFTNMRFKLFLLLNENIPQHKAVIDAIKEYTNILDAHIVQNHTEVHDYDNLQFLHKTEDLVDVSCKLVYFEWQKVQNLKI